MATDDIEQIAEVDEEQGGAEKPRSLLPLALAVGAVAAIVMTILTLI